MSPPKAQSDVTISHASPSDFLSISAIIPLANASNPIERFMFRYDSRDPSALPPSQQWALAQFEAAQKPSPGVTSHIFKAVIGNEPVGFAIIRAVHGNTRDKPSEHTAKSESEKIVTGYENSGAENGGQESSGWEADADTILNHDFCNVYIERLKTIYELHMKGKDHACK